MMTPADREALEALMAQMCAIHAHLTEHHAGVCVLHLDAAIAALESHLRRNGVSMVDELRQGLTLASMAKSTPSAAE